MTVTEPQADAAVPASITALEPSVLELAEQIGEEVAGPAAREVDRDARFPVEAITALRDARLLSALVPVELGGRSSTITEVASAVQALGRHCGSTALIYAMHHIQVAVLVHHGKTPRLREYLREVARDELLLASATTELGTGGDVRTSICAVEQDGDHVRLTKKAPVISYGHRAQGILATARRTPDSPPNDQVVVVLPAGTYELEQTSVWDTLGFRGTCSDGFVLTAEAPADLVVADPFSDISAHTMLPTTHVLWASVWLGIAERAVSAARSYLRAEARRSPGVTPPAAVRVAELVGLFEQLSAVVHGAALEYEEALTSHRQVLTTLGFAIRMNTVKTTASVAAADIVNRALFVCGMAGYSETSPYSLGLQLRDMAGAALMIHNDRILANTAQMLLVAKES
ncbi:acyl-CoA dehydrogenase family protein [Aquihabitans sp. McL0605]|uniref:acyl-CoA dehydrogenase family protein n=1 Tax=Aquihabitans sp. McL0605 TaxID=3415671 RepID=UPI003CF586E9